MTIPYYRCVEDTDDGCAVYQCLNCKATWEWRGGSAQVRYCMYCGAEITVLECRQHGQPRWQYELQRRLSSAEYWQIINRCIDLSREVLSRQQYWLIEERRFWLNGGDEQLSCDWRTRRIMSPSVTVRDAYAELLRARHAESIRDTEEDPDYDPVVDLSVKQFRYEFRLRRE